MNLRAFFAALSFVLAGAALASPPPEPSPSQLFGPLYRAVEMDRIFPDSKTFADASPRRSPAQIDADFAARTSQHDAALKRFVLDDFTIPPAPAAPTGVTPSQTDMIRHIETLWPRLTRSTTTVPVGSSALPLPKPYVVPGGRFRELYYWDSYFTMLGLVRSGRTDLAEDMIDDFGSLIDRYGHIPNGARTYYLSRSQPPVFALMIGISRDRQALARRNAWLIAEHRFWMAGEAGVKPGEADRRVVRLADGSLLNRYWDDSPTPRDESYREDVLLAEATPARAPADLWRNVRAAAESGWDFSSRWLADGKSLSTIRTTRLAPVDLNSLMYLMERKIAADCRALADAGCARDYDRRADERRGAILGHMWNGRFFADFDLDRGAATGELTAAAAFPLFAGLASPGQARSDAEALEPLIGLGGLTTTLVRSGQQWDAPNGWAPLQWIAVQGLRRYGLTRLADRISSGWLSSVEREYRASGKMLEKYDVLEVRPGGGGEYPTQDGFGWTNGVTLALMRSAAARR